MLEFNYFQTASSLVLSLSYIFKNKMYTLYPYFTTRMTIVCIKSTE